VLVVPIAIGVLLSLHLAVVWRQKHTQFPGEGRSERNVVGTRLWPSYAAASIGLFFLVAGVVAALGGLFQINPVWLYGPYNASIVTTPAQPDWYMGWLEGALRLFPAFDVVVFGYTVPNLFFAGVLFPGVTFVILYLWPWLEARVTGDRREHHLLDLPSHRPVRTALGAAAFTFYLLLFVAGSNDVIALTTGTSVRLVTWILRIAVLTVPLLVGLLAHRLLRDAPGRVAAQG
jgi:ubiquinol-cytochrome c reductase cytochrome b subunit